MKYQRNQRVHLTHPKFLTTTWLLATLTLLWATLAWAIAIPPAWQDQLQETGTARVIVVLNVPVQPEGTLNEADAIVAQRAQIAQAQQLLLDSLQPKGSADMRFETIPALVMVADSQTLTQLQDHPLVASLQLDTADEAMAGQTVADQLKDLEQVYETSPSYAPMAAITVSPASAREGDVRELMVANLQSVGITTRILFGKEDEATLPSTRNTRAANPIPGVGTVNIPQATGYDKVVIYQHINYGGARQELNVGSYDIKSLSIGNDQLSSLKVPKGMKVTLYEHAGFAGRTKTFTADTSWVGNDFNDLTSSIRVEQLPSPSSKVVIYQHNNYGGARQELNVGSYSCFYGGYWRYHGQF